MQPSSSVVTGIYDDSFFVAVTVTEQFAVYIAEAWTVHAVYVCNSSSGKSFDHLFISLYPAFVEQFILLTCTDGLDGYREAFSVLRVVDAELYVLSCFSFQHRIIICIFQDRLSINFFNDTTCGHICLFNRKRAFRDNFLDFQSISFIAVVEEYTQACSGQSGSRSIISGSCM